MIRAALSLMLIAAPVQAATVTMAYFAPQPITKDDLVGFAGGAACDAYDIAGDWIMHTEGIAVMRFHGERRMLREDGIGTSTLYSADHEPDMVVTMVPRTGVRTKAYDNVTMRAKTMSLTMNHRTYTLPIILKCES